MVRKKMMKKNKMRKNNNNYFFLEIFLILIYNYIYIYLNIDDIILYFFDYKNYFRVYIFFIFNKIKDICIYKKNKYN